MANIDVTTMDNAAFQKHLASLVQAGDIAAIASATAQWQKAQRERERAQEEARRAKLAKTTATIKAAIDAVVQAAKDAGDLDDADGVWYVDEFGGESSCRLVKRAAVTRQPRSTNGTSSGSYVSVDVSSKTLLDEVGSEVYVPAGTTRKIAGVEHTFDKDLTFAEAWELSSNGGWRNSVRMAMLKKTGRV